jgi:hypothetical protein
MWRCLIAFVGLLQMSVPAWGSQAWGIGSGNTTSIVLNPIDVTNGAVGPNLVLGDSLQFTNVDDLASDPIRYRGLIWAVRNSSAGNELIAVSPLQQKIVSYALIDASTVVESLAVNPVDGVMYGASTNALYSLNPFTGVSTFVGITRFPLSKGLGFDNAGQLYGIEDQNRLVRVSTADASVTLVATLALSRMEDIAARPENGVMYGLGFGGYQLFTIDLNNGALTSVGPSLTRPSGLAFTNVPEPSSLAFVTMVAGTLAFRRRLY